MPPHPLRLALAACCLAAVSSCESATAPHTLGHYRLTSVNGTELPTSVSLGLDCQMVVDSGYLNVQAAGDFGLGYQGFVAACALPGSGARWTSAYAGTALVAADSILFQLEPPYDTVRFVGRRTGAGTWTTIVPQLPSAQGPPVALGFQYVGPL